MNDARERIFAKLRAATGNFNAPATEEVPIEILSPAAKIAKLKERMEAVHTEIHVLTDTHWLDKIIEILLQRKVRSLLHAPATFIGQALQNHWAAESATLPELIAYDQAIESFKETLFEVDASITTTKGGIADSGSLILWPDEHEPRLMSLVPPIHIALLAADKIYHTFAEAITEQQWHHGMPTNALLISGPSKTADIELTLTFGVHGPKELIVLITPPA